MRFSSRAGEGPGSPPSYFSLSSYSCLALLSRIDLFAKTDALHSIANYLRQRGWECTMEKARKFRVILDYNKSSVYANTVLAVAERLENKSRTKR